MMVKAFESQDGKTKQSTCRNLDSENQLIEAEDTIQVPVEEVKLDCRQALQKIEQWTQTYKEPHELVISEPSKLEIKSSLASDLISSAEFGLTREEAISLLSSWRLKGTADMKDAQLGEQIEYADENEQNSVCVDNQEVQAIVELDDRSTGCDNQVCDQCTTTELIREGKQLRTLDKTPHCLIQRAEVRFERKQA